MLPACASLMLLCCYLEILPGLEACREISAVCRSLMVPRAVPPGVNCIRSDSSVSASSAFTRWQALTHCLHRPRTDLHCPPCWERPTGLETRSSWDRGVVEEGLYYSVRQDVSINTALCCLNVTICLLRQLAKWECTQAGAAASHCLCSPAVVRGVKIHPAFTHWVWTPKECSRSVAQILLATLLSL